MNRVVARVPDSVEELCVIRIGLVVRKVSGLLSVSKFRKAIERSAIEAKASNAGLLDSERFLIKWNHFGFLQYWRSFQALEEWSHKPPHSTWWREALERMRQRGDLGVYHETFLVASTGVESIYLDCPSIGISSFGVTGEAVGSSTTSRDRLGRRSAKG
jgi:Domain of unknown function (DUF4188)